MPNHFAGDPEYDPSYNTELIWRHVHKRPWDTSEPTWRQPANASGHQRTNPLAPTVPPHLLRHQPHHMQLQPYHAILDILRKNKTPRT